MIVTFSLPPSFLDPCSHRNVCCFWDRPSLILFQRFYDHYFLWGKVSPVSSHVSLFHTIHLSTQCHLTGGVPRPPISVYLFLFFFSLFTSLAVPSLSCDTCNLPSLLQLWLWHVGYSSLTRCSTQARALGDHQGNPSVYLIPLYFSSQFLLQLNVSAMMAQT